MKYEIKQLKQGGKVFMPQTVAEAVLVKEGSNVITLDKVLNRRITGSQGISVSRIGNTIDIAHTNQIVPNGSTQPLQIQYDNNGHIIGVIPLGTLTVTANSEEVLKMNGSADQTLAFGDDFQNINNNITIRWNNHGTT